MKKIFSVVFTLVLVFALSASVFAATSKETEVEVSAATDADGNTVEVTLGTAEETISADDAADLLGDDDVTLLNVMEVTVPDGTEFPVTITFSVDGVEDGDTVYVLHYTDGAWESLEATAGDGTVTCEFDSLSPVAILVSTADSTTSPTTGEAGTIAIVGLVAVAAVVTAYGVSRKVTA